MRIYIFLFIAATNTVFAQDSAKESGNSATSASRYFDGFYVGLAAGSQNMFGGSFVDGSDVLAQESRFATDLAIGFRKQLFKHRLVAGVEFQFGLTDGNLTHSDPGNQLHITYKNNTQRALGLILGVPLGARKNYLLFIYGNETTRNFDVTIVDRYGPYYQKDEQGMLKYGLGAEVNLYKKWNVRASVGKLRVDFGDQITNIDVEDKIDVMAGIVYQF